MDGPNSGVNFECVLPPEVEVACPLYERNFWGSNGLTGLGVGVISLRALLLQSVHHIHASLCLLVHLTLHAGNIPVRYSGNLPKIRQKKTPHN